jgi:hypothetical protein
MKKRFLLCRPQGGLNDILCRIKVCYDYAVKFNRILIIDTLTKTYLNCNFGKLFEFLKSDIVTFVDQPLLQKLSSYDNFSIVQERPKPYVNCYPVSNLNFYTNENINFSLNRYVFNFEQDYSTTVLYYQAGGCGQKLSYNLLKQNIKKFNCELKRYIISLLPKEPYISIHIRHTDYITKNYIKFLLSIKDLLTGKLVLICSDSKEVKKTCNNILDNCRLFSLNALEYSSDEVPLHKISEIKYFQEDDKCFLNMKANGYTFGYKEYNIQTLFTFIDFFGLIYSEKIFVAPITHHKYSLHNPFLEKEKQNYISGFAQLALNIHKDQEFKKLLLSC